MSEEFGQKFPYSSAVDFHKALKNFFVRETWSFKIKKGEFLIPSRGKGFCFSTKIRIPVSGSVLFPQEVIKIIDTPEFQRLRGTKQLGPTCFVFPGAVHSRFEHSIGAYHLALRYLEKLSQVPGFVNYAEPIEETVKITVLGALLHDIGHYPYSHWIEEIKGWRKGFSCDSHELRAAKIIENSDISKIISDLWGVDFHSVPRVIGDHGKNQIETAVQTTLHGILDLDKLDYLIRDSIHCGVNYGKGIDLERFLDSLYFNPEKGNPGICLTNKGRTYFLSVLTCRNIMYHEVYWHKTVRAFTGMFKTFFFEMVNRNYITKADSE